MIPLAEPEGRESILDQLQRGRIFFGFGKSKQGGSLLACIPDSDLYVQGLAKKGDHLVWLSPLTTKLSHLSEHDRSQTFILRLFLNIPEQALICLIRLVQPAEFSICPTKMRHGS